MNVDPFVNEPISPAVWERQEMRAALARRDLKLVYELLQRSGVSQRSISRRTGQSPSEIYKIMNGRQVQAHDVLTRVADGLGIPRGYMGLAYDESTEAVLGRALATISTDADERQEVRRALAHAANTTMGADVADVASWWQPVDSQIATAPDRIGMADVVHLTALTSAMRAVDYQHGGGACRDAIAAQVRWAQQLLLADASDETRKHLLIALADLHNLAGWTSFDVGMYSVARRHFSRALEQAQATGHQSLAANVLNRLGRLHLHRGLHIEALRFFQLGQIAAQDSGCGVTVAILCANEAWAYAHLGDRAQMNRSLVRSRNELENADRDGAEEWVRFFDEAELSAITGVTLAALPDASGSELDDAIDHMASASERSIGMTRSQVLIMPNIARAHLRAGHTDAGVRIGHEAVDGALTVRSVRPADRLIDMVGDVATLERDDARDLHHRIQLLAARPRT
ncbi:tetratricopeptide repeat protein [Promicromonospora sp. AC04]|uniref:helix-turn-helix domain-containing protein n=1 Tax=Promicromonospora sp. AC04 TaxID=2135723 RepID=UPI000D38CBAE|nr:helix-turn-helix transcriptional regulator [Promicromonospora sp. AC04]PUB32584.1 tetratricopeptide repeat protein [Promicromonospora sp. AC04]